MIRRLLCITLALVGAVHAADLGPGPVPTNSTLLAPGPIGSTTPSSGAFTTLTSSGLTTVTNNTASTTSSSGALVVTGGEGVGGHVTVGGGMNITSSAIALRIDASANNLAFDFACPNTTDQAFGIRGFAGTTANDYAIRLRNAADSADLFKVDGTGDVFAGTGNLVVSIAGKGVKVKEGTNARMGTATLVAGASTVANTSVTATTRIFLESNADGGTPGWLRVSTRVAATSFTITSSSGTDTSTVAWLLVEPSP